MQKRESGNTCDGMWLQAWQQDGIEFCSFQDWIETLSDGKWILIWSACIFQ